MSHTTSPASTTGGSPFAMAFMAIFVIMIIAMVKGKYADHKKEKAVEEKAWAARVAAAPIATVATAPVEPDFVEGTTPVCLDANYRWNGETGGKTIRIKMAGIPSPIDYDGVGKKMMPEPAWGPSCFWDPSDSTNGRINFRLYRIKK